MSSLSRFSSWSSTASTTSSVRRDSTASSWSSSGDSFDLLEPVSLDLPHDLVEASLRQPTRRQVQSQSRCSLSSDDEKMSIFSFPRNHTSHSVCPRHGIVHDPALALPARDSRHASSRWSSRSSTSSCSSTSSKRSLKCTLKRVVTLKRP
ncbi:hypothetical protein Rhopal_003176-T1 [Rhodotorula paludigena]|uniref:Uncharacterized protein n=1 Tax=Rhodotorula paludigena TaxID=86838 RepID=A0AAV5GLD2_9BASI|nr:hypothetical protein Rhopal_003176-T1 [Rhodotorula paludigena]